MGDPVTLTAIGWGMSAASWLISPVLSRLVNKCFDALGLDPRFQSQKDALDNKLEHLWTTLLPQLLILADAAQKCPHRRELEAWLQKLKLAYYEAEDLLGLVEYKRLEKKVNSLFPSAYKCNFWKMKLRKNNLLKGLENLEKVVNEAMKFVNLLNILSTSSVNNSVLRSTEQSRETLSTLSFTVIGRDRDRDHIVQLLRENFPECSSNSKCYSVIGIWGMGGSGKTTLAQYVCEKEKKTNYFDLVIWAHVSQNFDLPSIFKRIWESAIQEDCPNCDSIEGLSSRLQEKLRGKRFFLVLDDVWCDKDVSVLQLEQLFAPLQRCKRGSKILVTTRIEEAAKALGAIDPIPLRQLEHDEFLDLFMSRALGDHVEERLTVIGKQIAAKLHRSPLAATTVAAQLRRRRDPDFWSSMLDQNLLNETMGALLLSYQNLPPHLQRCFAFCSLLPKGHKFNQDHLVNLWIGEGFIEAEGSTRHVRDIGNDYILELISSSFLQLNKTEWGGTFYYVHDLLHDLAEKVSEGEYFRIEGGAEREIPIKTRHLYIGADMFEEHVRKICKLKDLRTIIIGRSQEATSLEKRDFNALFKRSKMLYVVDIHNSVFDGLPESLFYLENLRYLNCKEYTGAKYPKLLNRLYQLRHLKTSGMQFPNIGRLTLLQHLPCFEVENGRGCGLKQLEHLSDLYGELNVYDLNNVKSREEARQSKLSDKKGLRQLNLKWLRGTFNIANILDDRDSLTQIKDAEIILDELRPPLQLETLTIVGYSGKRCPIWFSEYNKNTTRLKKLELRECPCLEALPETNNLIHLQSLTIRNLHGLKWWASLPTNLVNLALYDCGSLAFMSEEELKIRMYTRGEEQSPIDKELEKLEDSDIYEWYLIHLEKLDSICQVKEVNKELHLPLKLEKLKMDSCFISDKIFTSSLQDHALLTHLVLGNIIPISCISREVLSSLINLRVLIIRECVMLTSVDGFETLSSLEELTIGWCPCLTIESLDVSNSKSLRSLTLGDCTNLVSLMGLNELNNLQDLRVVGCDKLQCSSDASKLQGVRKTLTISKISLLELISRDGLSSLRRLILATAEQEQFTQEEREMLSNLSSLEEIEFDYYKRKSLPDLSFLRSVTRLAILRCQHLTSLSELPPSLQSIRIVSCTDEFTRSCEDTNHPNGQKIFRIPKKHINRD